ncbi:MAG TPA: DUF4330 domain-containing protein [Clostridiaceae bacterium]|nr:DUF4330 domain-containing protein [Clostridiaceae bacterium]HPP36708.1 DUF4330 domain-containing protein [Clostridiales bacterium]
MKMIDEKGRVFGKINIFDLIVLLALIVAVGGISYKVIKDRIEGSGQAPTKTYIVTVKSSAMPASYSEALKKDPRIYYDNDQFVNARIVDVREEPAVITVQTDDGKLVEAVSPDLKDVYIDIEVEDKLDIPDIRIGRYAVAVGGKITVKTIYAVGADSLVLDIREK